MLVAPCWLGITVYWLDVFAGCAGFLVVPCWLGITVYWLDGFSLRAGNKNKFSYVVYLDSGTGLQNLNLHFGWFGFGFAAVGGNHKPMPGQPQPTTIGTKGFPNLRVQGP